MSTRDLRLEDASLEALLDALQACPRLESLAFHHAGLGAGAGHRLARPLARLRSLRTLRLADNRLGVPGAGALVAAVVRPLAGVSKSKSARIPTLLASFL